MTQNELSYDECVALAARNEGKRVRFTYRPGVYRIGVVTMKWRWNDRPREPWPVNEQSVYLDGNLVTGELAGAIRFEVMQPNGRYKSA